MMFDDTIDEELAVSDDGPGRRRVIDRMMLREPIHHLDPRRPAVCIAADRTVAEAIRLMREHSIGSVLVTEGEQLAGIVTERDILCKVSAVHADPKVLCVAEVMTASPETLTLDDPIIFALNKMEVGGFRHVPLVDKENRPVGIISVRHIVHYVVHTFGTEVFNIPPAPDKEFGTTREGA
jgi:CBS domain-containing protein